jgi:predicted adenine nucleotide alpha hydrolase (AANH) superfamily ATPase
MRLSRTAQTGVAHGFDAFSTTLLVSPYQEHDLIVRAGEEAAQAHGIAFHYADYRGNFAKTREIAIEVGLYRQKYCGCIFSEAERYAGQIDRLVHKAVLSAQ